MKKLLRVLLVFCFILALAACGGEKEINGTITEYLRDDSRVNAFLMESGGKTIGVRMTEETGVYSGLVIITGDALRDAEYAHMEVTVSGKSIAEKLTTADGTEVPTYTAETVIIDSVPYGEPLVLTDGTTAEGRLNKIGLSYYAPDGTMLLQIDNQLPGELQIGWADHNIVSKKVQDKIRAHYKELGDLYDAAEQTERAWTEYNELGKPRDFRAYVAHQITGPQLYNDRIIFYSTDLTLSRNAHSTYDKHFYDIYDRTTGEPVSLWELFRPDEDTVRQWLLNNLEPTDPARRAMLAEILKPEWIFLGNDALSLYIPWDALPNDEGPIQSSFYYTDNVLAAMIQDWVLPLQPSYEVLPDTPAQNA